MVYAPQRRHAVAQMSTAVQALALVQHFYFPSTPVLVLRIFCLAQIRAPVIIQPTRSLFSLFFLVTSTNLGVVFLHLMFYDYNIGSKGLILDFVGQANAASLLRIMLLDLVIFVLLVLTLIVGYVVNYSPTLPKTDLFPYDDLLLPPEAPVSPMPEGDIDVESGDQFHQRRHGKGPRYHNVATDDTELWLEDEAGEDSSLLSRPQSHLAAGAPIIRRRRSGVPLVFNLPLYHMFNLLFKLPGPSPLRTAAGGSPFTTPPTTPRTTRDMAVNALAAMIQETANRAPPPPPQPPTAQPQRETRGSPRSSTDSSRSSEAQRGDGQRIPGDYWTSRA